jgi:hypothetical protein
MLGDDVSSGYVDLSGRVIVFRKGFRSRRPEHCRGYLEIAQLMKCPSQKTDESKKYARYTAAGAQTQISELARSRFHFAGGLTKLMSRVTWVIDGVDALQHNGGGDAWQRSRTNFTL